MDFIRKSLLILMGIGSPILTQAAVLTWDQCVVLAEKNNPELKSAQYTFESTERQEAVARGGFLPRLTGDLGYNYSESSNGNFSNLTNPFGAATQGGGTYSASLSASQNLFSGLQDLGRLKQAEANTAAARATLQTVRARITYELKSAYEGLSYATQSVKLTQEIIRRRKENYRLVELRYNSGNENKGSVLLSEAYLRQAEYDDLQAGNAKRIARAQLSRSLGMDDTTELEIAGEIPVQDPKNNDRPDFRDLAVATPDFQQSAAQEKASHEAITIARGTFFPTLNLTGNISRQGDEFFPQDSRRWSVGVALSFPLFNGLRDLASLRSASATWNAAVFTRENVGRQLVAKLEQSYSNFIEAIAKLKMDQGFKAATEVRAEIARKKYNNGLLTFENWDIIENDLISRQKSYLVSKRDRVLSEAAWEQALGKGIFK